MQAGDILTPQPSTLNYFPLEYPLLQHDYISNFTVRYLYITHSKKHEDPKEKIVFSVGEKNYGKALSLGISVVVIIFFSQILYTQKRKLY